MAVHNCGLPYTVDRIDISRPWLIAQVHPDIDFFGAPGNLHLKGLFLGSKGLDTRVPYNAKLLGGAIYHGVIQRGG